jgi:PAS domain S-box-containing protein
VLADAVLRASSDAIVASDKDGIIQFWNAGTERIFGYTNGDAMGMAEDPKLHAHTYVARPSEASH